MPIDTKTAPRRDLHFASLDEAVADVRALVGQPLRTTGNRTPDDLVGHLADSIEANVDGVDASAIPLVVRLLAVPVRPYLRNRFCHRPMPAGATLPEAMNAQFNTGRCPDLAAAADAYEAAVRRLREAKMLPKHPVFGTFAIGECEQFHCRHAELHLSFIHPAAATPDDTGKQPS